MTAVRTTVARSAARDLLHDLVSIPSPSGAEAEAAETLAAFLRDHGREARLDDVGNVRAPGDDALLLTSHVDTVPGDGTVRREDGVLWGRGAVDATGPLCAMAVAAVETGATFVGVVGEEADSRGARHLVADRKAPTALVNGEPGGWEAITLGYRGFLAGTATVSTEATHTSRPEPNAIQRLLTWWATVEESFGTAAGGADDPPVFERVTATPTAFDGGLAADGSAVEASVAFQLRLPPSRSAADVRATVDEAATSHGVAVEWADSIPPTVQSARTDLAAAFRRAIRRLDGEPRLVRKTGTSDMNVYADAWDCPMVTYGPGDSALDHAPDERIDLAEYDRAIDVLRTVARERVAEGAG